MKAGLEPGIIRYLGREPRVARCLQLLRYYLQKKNPAIILPPLVSVPVISVSAVIVAERPVFLESGVSPVAVVDAVPVAVAVAVAAVVAALLQRHVVVNLDLRPWSVDGRPA